MALPSKSGSGLQKLVIVWICLLTSALLGFNLWLGPAQPAGAHVAVANNEPASVSAPPPVRVPAAVSVGAPAVPSALAATPASESLLAVGQLMEESENNAPRPPPRAGDSEEVSLAPDVLVGADDTHMHGRLGLLPDGSPRIPPTPLPPAGLSHEERRDAHRGFCFNSRKSDALSLDRPQQDVRSPACRAKHANYPQDLPVASVVIVFHNENLSILLRSVHSVLNHSPPRLLREVILVDDASTPDAQRFYEKHWQRLQGELAEYCRHLPKVRLVRLKSRRGLMLARMEGVWRATAEVTVFLDSHIEATPGWLEPLLARIHEDRGHVVVPSIDSIGNEDFVYRTGGGLGVLGFSWTLGQEPSWASTGDDGTSPAKSPVMAGGLFASDTRMFLHLGGYDPEMRLYGGEEMEIGFRTWMCGGDIEYIPCSHVGHVFRTPDYWKGQVYKVPGEEISRNKLRTAEVWMDEYKELVKIATAPLPSNLPIGDMEPRHRLRRKLNCKDFNWFLEHVTPKLYAPKLTEDSRTGSLMNEALKACLDTMGGSGDGAWMGAYPCHGQHGTQALLFDGDGTVRLPQVGYKMCMAADRSHAVLRNCHHPKGLKWEWDRGTGLFKLRGQDLCLEASAKPVSNSPFSLALNTCDPGAATQKWTWS